MEITHGSSGGSGGTPGGSDTEVQFNDDGSFGGDPGLTYNKTTNILSADTIAAFTGENIQITNTAGDGKISVETDGTIIAAPAGASGFKIKDPGGAIYAILNTGSLGTDRTYGFPDRSGTIAMSDQIPALQTDGVANGNQTLLNLAAGSNVDLTDNGTGTVTVDVTGIPSPLTLQTDGTPNGSQTLLNLVAGTNIDLTDNGTGSVTIDSLASGLSQMQVMARLSIGF